MGEARALLGQCLDQLRRVFGELLHVTGVFGVQHAPRHLVADLVTVLGHFRALAQHFSGHFKSFREQRRRPLFLGQIQRHFPANQRHLPRNLFGEYAGFGAAIAQLEQGQCRAEPEETHAVAALALDFVTLLRQRQTVDLHHVVQHAGEHAYHFTVFVPVEARVGAERVDDEMGEVDRAQQAGAIGRQRLLAAGIGRANRFAPPVVVQLVDPVDKNEARLGVIVGGDHDHVPQMSRLDSPVDLAGHQSVVAHDVAVMARPFAPQHLLGVGQIQLGFFLQVQRKDQRPIRVGFYRLHEFVGDQQAEVELPQPAVFAFGADEFAHVRMTDIKGAHLRTPAPAGRADGKAHLVEDIHERQRAAGMRASAGHKGAARAQGAEFVTDAAAGLERQASLMDLAENVVHRVGDGAGNGAVDRRGGRFVVLRASVGDDPPGGDGAIAQRPEKLLIPELVGFRMFDISECPRDPLPGVIDAVVDGAAIFAGQPVFLRPDVFGGHLQGYFRGGFRLCRDGPVRLRHALRILVSMEWKPKHEA